MEKILGLDLGTNSIGWAIREVNNDLENQIIDKGVLTFDKGVAEDKSGEHPMVQKRTEARGKRRNYQAEKYRKWELLECLINEGMCPLTIEELNEWRHYTKGFGRKYPQSEKFIQWLRYDFDGDSKPDFERLGYSKHESYYLFRSLIIDELKIDIFKREPHIIGRVLYQLVQRRGYNDGQSIDETEKEELSKTIKKGGGESGAIGADEIEPFIAKYKTLGAALYEVQKQNGVRIRKRYNLRSQFDKELQLICKVQNLEHLYKMLWGAIIWQRPLRSQKGLVGVCTFEKNKRRCPISHPLYEEYRTWVFINNLKIKPIIKNDVSINKIELHEALHNVVYPQFFKVANDFKLSSIAKELEKVGFEITAKFPSDTKVISFSFLNQMKEIFGVDWELMLDWENVLNEETKIHTYSVEDLWHLHFTKTTNKKTGEEPFDFLKRFAIEKLHLDDDKAEKFAKIKIQQGYAPLSAYAIRKILPYLQQGFIYSEAVYLANLNKVLGIKKLTESEVESYSKFIREIIIKFKYEQRKIAIINSLIAQYFEDVKFFEEHKKELITKTISENYGEFYWNSLPTQKAVNVLNDIIEETNSFLKKSKGKPESHFLKTDRLHDKIFIALMNEKGIPDNNIKYLWHPSEQETYVPAINRDGKYYLGSPEPVSKGLKNPMALKTMHKLKKLVNYLIQIGKIDTDTRIVIEIARELNDANKRKAIERWQREREKENENYKKQIIEINKECNTNFNEQDKNLIDRIRLWEEQKRQCLYTGKTIGLKEILDGSKYDFEHSIPASMSFDNELKNLTIADKTYNQQIKGKKLPSECPNYERDCIIKGVNYPAILNTIQIMFGKMRETEKRVKGKIIIERSFERIIELENKCEKFKYFAKIASTKESKDRNIIDKNYTLMELDYWRKKLQSFTITEYKAGWRNSQLKDTQTITKYALPYLKTVFNKVEVQKGNITSDFRKIYKIQPRFEKKERTKHSHHAIDAAVLTLIPPAAVRDKILLNFNEANENNQSYHVQPKQWNNFKADHILSIENDVLINYQAQYRTLTPTYKIVRKRGEVQYVKDKRADGKWQYKLDKVGNKIPLVAKGDSIRGQLHKESNYGAILKPKFDGNDKAINVNGKFLHEDKPSFVKRVHLEIDSLFGFKSTKEDPQNTKFIKQFEEIIDPYIRKLVISHINDGFSKGLNQKEIFNDSVWMLNSIGEKVHKIRRVRVYQGNITPPEIKKIESTFLSKHKHKQYSYSDNTDYVSMLCYKGFDLDKKKLYHFKPITALGFSKEKIIPNTEIQNGVLFNLEWELKPGFRVIVLNNKNEEINNLTEIEINKRIYIVNNVYPAYQGKYEYFYADINYHLSVISSEIKYPKRGKEISFESPNLSPLVRLNLEPSKSFFLIEGIDFEISIDGNVNLKQK